MNSINKYINKYFSGNCPLYIKWMQLWISNENPSIYFGRYELSCTFPVFSARNTCVTGEYHVTLYSTCTLQRETMTRQPEYRYLRKTVPRPKKRAQALKSLTKKKMALNGHQKRISITFQKDVAPEGSRQGGVTIKTLIPMTLT